MVPFPCYIVDAYWFGKLRCYYHPVDGWFQYDMTVPCTYTLASVGKYNELPPLNVYFDVNNNLIIDGPREYYPLSVQIQNVLGEKVLSKVVETKEEGIIVSSSTQMLFVEITSKEGRICRKKIIYVQGK